MARRNLVIYGWGNAGKTTIINKLYNRLQNTDPNIVIYRERKQLGKIEDNDFSAIIIYKGRSIVLYSAGDYINSIDEAIHGKERDFVNVIALSGTTDIEENIKIVDAFLEAEENMEDPVYKNRIDQIIEYENE